MKARAVIIGNIFKENSELYYTKEELEELKGKQKTAGGYHWEYI